MSSKRSSEKSRLLDVHSDGYESNADGSRPVTPLLASERPSININEDVESFEDSSVITASTRSTVSRGRPRARSSLSSEGDCEVVIDEGHPGTT